LAFGARSGVSRHANSGVTETVGARHRYFRIAIADEHAMAGQRAVVSGRHHPNHSDRRDVC